MTRLRKIRRYLNDQHGTAAIEFALLVGPLMLLMFGSIEVSRFIWVQNAVYETATSGARCMGIKAPDCAAADVFSASETTDFIRQTASSWGLNIVAADIAMNPTSGCGNATGFSSVVISHQFTSVLTALTGSRVRSEACFPNQN
jgi:Flp pilus assembly protein TadG